MEFLAPKNALIILVLGWFMALGHYTITCYEVWGDLELDEQLRILNKPAVTTIQTKYGDWYACVDFYEQPAFDHPLLKDNKYIYKMSSSNRQQGTNADIYLSDIWVNGKGCPSNTVPIKRVTKQDLIRANIAANLAYNISLDLNPGVQVAVLRTIVQKKYYGGGMLASVYHPPVQSNQYSSSHIKIQRGQDSISVGWTVNPSLYPDNETHLYIYTITKNSHCYNVYCPGFVTTTPVIPIDLVLKPYTKIDGPLYEVKLLLRKDAANGNWFLVYGKSNKDYHTIGFWPQRIFTYLADSADYVEWGGEVYSPPGTNPPPMGAGYVPPKRLKLYWDCYDRQIVLINENYEVDHNPPSLLPYNSSPRYICIDKGNAGPGLNRLIEFGGN